MTEFNDKPAAMAQVDSGAENFGRCRPNLLVSTIPQKNAEWMGTESRSKAKIL